MSLALGEHQDIARAVALIGGHDIGDGAARLGAALHLLRMDMVMHLLDEPVGLRQAIPPSCSSTQV